MTFFYKKDEATSALDAGTEEVVLGNLRSMTDRLHLGKKDGDNMQKIHNIEQIPYDMLYLPLKGIIMKDYYPSVGMRQMSDNDILFDADAWERMEKHMISEGYKAEHVGKGNHDVYHKPRLQALRWQWYRLAYLNGFLCLSECKGRHIQS